MKDVEQSRRLLREQIAATESQLQRLKEQLAELEQEPGTPTEAEVQTPNAGNWPLLQDEYRRYGRQMIVSQIGLKGQLSLRNAAVLLIGAGGLGCPAALYLAGAGVGKLGFVDGDRVEPSNLHRQVLHCTRNTGKFKVDSAIEYLKELNPHPTYVPYRSHLDSQNAPDIFAEYDVVLDCTDNPATRYLISDTAVVTGIPVVSASALRTEGQLMILNYPPRRPGDESGGPCYRCVFPKPPPADSVVSCADGGIIGPVVGMMGVMQALETIRVLTTPTEGVEVTDSNRIVPTLHIFSAYSTPPFRNVRLRRRRAKCMACSENASISVESLRAGSTDYVQFCGSSSPVSLLSPSERVSAKEFEGRYFRPCLESSQPKGYLIDVRDEVQFGICSLPTSLNIPLSTILASVNSTADEGENQTLPSWLPSDIATDNSTAPINIVCRLGNDSQTAVDIMKRMGLDRGGERYISDINGGLNAWRRDVDPSFPDY